LNEIYGYELIQNVRELSGGKIEWTEGMLYPMLHWMERENLIESEWRTTEDSGRRRRYYRIRREGRKALHSEQQQCDRFSARELIFCFAQNLVDGQSHAWPNSQLSLHAEIASLQRCLFYSVCCVRRGDCALCISHWNRQWTISAEKHAMGNFDLHNNCRCDNSDSGHSQYDGRGNSNGPYLIGVVVAFVFGRQRRTTDA